jgi:hypothetical protein
MSKQSYFAYVCCRTEGRAFYLYIYIPIWIYVYPAKKTKSSKMRNETMISKRAQGINWNTSVFMVLFHLGAVAALFLFSWQAVLAAIVLWWPCIEL